MAGRPSARSRELANLSVAELGELVEAALSDLSTREDPDAFAQLLQIQQGLGERLGQAARNLAERASWAGVAHLSGTTKQAAWSRWSGD